MGLIFKDADPKPLDPKTARNRAILLSLPFAIVGVLALVFLVHDELGSGFRMKKQLAMGLVSAAVTCGGFIALIFAITAKKQALSSRTSKTDDPTPWLRRADWAAGRVVSSARKASVLLWIFVAFWCAASAAISLGVMPQLLRQGSHIALLALVFPLVGLAIIYFALGTTLAWRRHARSTFTMPAVPAALGGALAGEVRVKVKLPAKHGWHLRMSCVRRTTTGASNNRQINEKVLWQDEKWLRPALPQNDSNEVRIPVFFELPGNLPEATVSRGDGIHWKLETSAELRGPDFYAAFEVPVFKLPEVPAPPADPTLNCRTSLDEIRQGIRSHIKVKDLAGNGKEIIFPPARNRGFASGATTVCLVWTGILALLVAKQAPLPFLLVLSAIDLLMIPFVFDLWFRHGRIVVNSAGMTVQKSWFAINKEYPLKVAEIKNISAEVSATVGHASYYDLIIRAQDGKEFVIVKNLHCKPEADWLVRQITGALKEPA